MKAGNGLFSVFFHRYPIKIEKKVSAAFLNSRERRFEKAFLSNMGLSCSDVAEIELHLNVGLSDWRGHAIFFFHNKRHQCRQVPLAPGPLFVKLSKNTDIYAFVVEYPYSKDNRLLTCAKNEGAFPTREA